MKRKYPIRKQITSGITAVIAITAILGGSGAVSAEPEGWAATGSLRAVDHPEPNAAVYFDNLAINLPSPPVVIQGTMMVPAKALLEGIGYTVSWNALKEELTAVHPSKPALTFWTNRNQAAVDGLIAKLPVSPYSSNQTLWIPLRLAAETGGMTVRWDGVNHLAFVSDPNALPVFSVATRADNGTIGDPAGLEQYMKSEWKADVRFSLIPPEYYREKTNVLIAAGEPTALMLLSNPYQYQDDLFQSVALDLTDALKAYPRLQALASSGSPAARTINGRLYGIPRSFDPHDAPFPALRQDWLNKLGLEQPKTMDELFDVLKAFVQKDPDGNGRLDTIGMTGYVNAAGLGSLSWVEQAYTGSPDRFSVLNGKVTDHAAGPEEKQALNWLARAYAEGLIDREFPVLSETNVKEQLNKGNVGAAAMQLDQAAALSADPQETWVPLPSIQASDNSIPVVPWNTTGNGMYIITRIAHTKPEQLLEWLDHGIAMSEAGEWNSIAGLNDTDRAAVDNLFGNADLLKGNSALLALPEDKRPAYESAVKEWRQTSYQGMTIPQADKLWSSGKYAELNSKLTQMKLEVILGKASMADWDKYIAEMTVSSDYKAMMSELNLLAVSL